jgi:hypothetical protein
MKQWRPVKSHLLEQGDTIYERPGSAMEMMLNNNHLRDARISSIKELCELSKDQQNRFMLEACQYASFKLAPAESTYRSRRELHVGVWFKGR